MATATRTADMKKWIDKSVSVETFSGSRYVGILRHVGDTKLLLRNVRFFGPEGASADEVPSIHQPVEYVQLYSPLVKSCELAYAALNFELQTYDRAVLKHSFDPVMADESLSNTKIVLPPLRFNLGSFQTAEVPEDFQTLYGSSDITLRRISSPSDELEPGEILVGWLQLVNGLKFPLSRPMAKLLSWWNIPVGQISVSFFMIASRAAMLSAVYKVDFDAEHIYEMLDVVEHIQGERSFYMFQPKISQNLFYNFPLEYESWDTKWFAVAGDWNPHNDLPIPSSFNVPGTNPASRASFDRDSIQPALDFWFSLDRNPLLFDVSYPDDVVLIIYKHDEPIPSAQSPGLRGTRRARPSDEEDVHDEEPAYHKRRVETTGSLGTESALIDSNRPASHISTGSAPLDSSQDAEGRIDDTHMGSQTHSADVNKEVETVPEDPMDVNITERGKELVLLSQKMEALTATIIAEYDSKIQKLSVDSKDLRDQVQKLTKELDHLKGLNRKLEASQNDTVKRCWGLVKTESNLKQQLRTLKSKYDTCVKELHSICAKNSVD